MFPARRSVLDEYGEAAAYFAGTAFWVAVAFVIAYRLGTLSSSPPRDARQVCAIECGSRSFEFYDVDVAEDVVCACWSKITSSAPRREE